MRPQWSNEEQMKGSVCVNQKLFFEMLFCTKITVQQNFFYWMWFISYMSPCLVKDSCYLEDSYDLSIFKMDLLTSHDRPRYKLKLNYMEGFKFDLSGTHVFPPCNTYKERTRSSQASSFTCHNIVYPHSSCASKGTASVVPALDMPCQGRRHGQGVTSHHCL